MAEDTDNTVRLGPGTLYGSIQTLLDAGYVEETAQVTEEERRRYYRLSGAGRAGAQSRSRAHGQSLEAGPIEEGSERRTCLNGSIPCCCASTLERSANSNLLTQGVTLEELPHHARRIDLVAGPGVTETIDANQSDLGAAVAPIETYR